MSYYPGLGKVNWGNALLKGTKSFMDSREKEEEKRKKEQKEAEEKLWLEKTRRRQEQMWGQQDQDRITKEAREKDKHRWAKETQDQRGKEWEHNNKINKAKEDALARQEEERKKYGDLDQALKRQEQIIKGRDGLANGSVDLETFNKTFDRKLESFKIEDRTADGKGWLAKAKEGGGTRYIVNHPKMDGPADLGFSNVMTDVLGSRAMQMKEDGMSEEQILKDQNKITKAVFKASNGDLDSIKFLDKEGLHVLMGSDMDYVDILTAMKNKNEEAKMKVLNRIREKVLASGMPMDAEMTNQITAPFDAKEQSLTGKIDNFKKQKMRATRTSQNPVITEPTKKPPVNTTPAEPTLRSVQQDQTSSDNEIYAGMNNLMGPSGVMQGNSALFQEEPPKPEVVEQDRLVQVIDDTIDQIASEALGLQGMISGNAERKQAVSTARDIIESKIKSGELKDWKTEILPALKAEIQKQFGIPSGE